MRNFMKRVLENGFSVFLTITEQSLELSEK